LFELIPIVQHIEGDHACQALGFGSKSPDTVNMKKEKLHGNSQKNNLKKVGGILGKKQSQQGDKQPMGVSHMKNIKHQHLRRKKKRNHYFLHVQDAPIGTISHIIQTSSIYMI
jgi:hypothetical protein